jgi:demethylmenaquinone methyltransferase/2-methoxy-6-polyprenyl-1,4-benzoquinol methylase
VAWLEITRPRPLLAALFRMYFLGLVPRIGRLISGDPAAYSYLPRSAYAFLDARELAATMRQAGFETVRFRRLGFGAVSLHVGIRAGFV